MTHPYLTFLTETECQRLDLVGGKARGLARLTALGLPVPGAFCLTTEAYRAFVAANSLGQVVHSSLDGLSRSHLGQATQVIRRAFLTGVMPADLISQIEIAYQRLGAGAVAIRSSATLEDQPTSSVAGGHDTLLNVRSLPSLAQAIQECWASLWSERAILYRQMTGIEQQDVALAVIVQQMVRARVSGVVFTADPVTCNQQRIILEACWGLGQALVSGEVTPQHYEIDRKSLAVDSQRLGLQTEMMTFAEEEGIKVLPLSDSLRGHPCLDAELLLRIADLAILVEGSFGAPQDIEWAVGDETGDGTRSVCVLQARPITTLRGKGCAPHGREVRWENPVPGAVWVRGGGGLVEYLAGPLSPLYATAQLPSICRLHDDQALQMGTYSPPPTYALINGHYYSRQDYRLKPSGLLLPFRYWKVARTKVRWWREHALPAHLAELAQLSSFDVAGAFDVDLLRHLRKLFEFNARAWDDAVWASKNSQFTEPLFCGIFQKFIRPRTGGDALVFLRGFDSQTMAGERAQWRLVQAALASAEIANCLRRNPPRQALEQLSALPSARRWLEGLLSYCRTYGHATACHDYLQSTQADDLLKAIAAIQTRMELPAADPARRQEKLADERDEATKEALRKLSGSRTRACLFRWALAWAQEGASIREDAFFHAFQGWPLARRAILELGKRLARAGAFGSPEDIFFLTWEEIEEAAVSHIPPVWHAEVNKRRREHDWQCTLTPPQWVPMEGPPQTLGRKLKVKIKRLLLGHRENGDGRLRGTPVSPGVVTGPARVIRSTTEFGRLHGGDILVAPTATPEWMPAFAVAAGLVTDAGGPLSHSSIIVREFGIPAVMGAPTATDSIADGQLITLDGSRGVVQLL
jgi:rifampicin phosphotransferase